ncbi:hypothetical protein IQ273_24425 [Nodosilinea sp. LEGE 07298]|uniref:hypothetical protein n=1 Tax=Nodosilinea sp. LEGE 07298 TaxID=2777970 RepID=UPI00187F9DFF|nr:hypothetical protein [Nodosilinea sp. LEGE 07298]MBE9112544.1 hypothetical protein [Nodosilinea sp. LEGE 07298]
MSKNPHGPAVPMGVLMGQLRKAAAIALWGHPRIGANAQLISQRLTRYPMPGH